MYNYSSLVFHLETESDDTYYRWMVIVVTCVSRIIHAGSVFVCWTKSHLLLLQLRGYQNIQA